MSNWSGLVCVWRMGEVRRRSTDMGDRLTDRRHAVGKGGNATAGRRREGVAAQEARNAIEKIKSSKMKEL
ncbi:unnamed protein product [Clavelina lepadiformis]|uniref:Uncharacterized protein n=1 Tax=Clavelina lepadiformis TaxID=159417 RepID=A0ABP0FQT6_CLALP